MSEVYLHPSFRFCEHMLRSITLLPLGLKSLVLVYAGSVLFSLKKRSRGWSWCALGRKGGNRTKLSARSKCANALFQSTRLCVEVPRSMNWEMALVCPPRACACPSLPRLRSPCRNVGRCKTMFRKVPLFYPLGQVKELTLDISLSRQEVYVDALSPASLFLL